MSDRQGTLAEAIRTAVESAQRSQLGWLPAKVVKWESSKCRVDCQILVKDAYTDENGERQADSFAVVPSVPVQFMGSGDYRLTVPISAGDGGSAATTGMLIFAGRSLDKWLSGSGGEVDPELDHDHAMADAAFIPGLKPFGAPWQDVPSEGISIGKDQGLQATITDSLIKLATPAGDAQYVALSNKVKQWFDAFNAAVTGWIPVPNDGGAALKSALATLIAGTPSTDVAASKVKAE